MSFTEWIGLVLSSWPMALLTLLTLGVVFVNGWTDAPNAIASCVVTRVMSPKTAVIFAGICNLLGLLFSVLVNRSVADTVYTMVDLGADGDAARLTLCSGMFSVVVWACAAWRFGIPTSESHALIAGITGAVFALRGGIGIRFRIWARVLWGLFLSVGLGFLWGFLCVLVIVRIFFRASRRKTQRVFFKLQLLGGGVNAFLHGAQDGQKFIGVLLLSATSGVALTDGVPFWMVLLCSLVLFFGTCLGGGRIIRAVGMKMVKMERYQGVAADFAAGLSLAVCTVFGLPVSTTHVKTTAVMGAGSALRLRSVNWSVAGQMALAWVLTFPGCGILGYGMAKLFFLME